MRITAGTTPLVDITDRITRLLGNVRDEVLRQVLLSGVFWAGDVAVASVGNVSQVQLFNPAASGKVGWIFYLDATMDTATAVLLSRFDTALVTLVTQGVNTDTGAAAGVLALRKSNPVALQGTQILRTRMGAVNEIWYPGRGLGFARLNQGHGLVLGTGTTNVALEANFMWIEV